MRPSAFGRNNVIVLASLSKVAQDVDAAIKRVRGYVAPVNSMRFMGKTPCAVDGTCHNCVPRNVFVIRFW